VCFSSRLGLTPASTNHLTSISATALFWFELPSDPTAVSEGPRVHAHNFGRPIVTFAPVAGSLDLILVSLDAHWNDEGPPPDVPLHARLVRLGFDSVRLSPTSTTSFSSRVAQASEISPPPLLLSTLNGASVIPGVAICPYLPCLVLSTSDWQPKSASSPRFTCTNPSQVFRKTWMPHTTL
jgi:hypothetical protein